MAYQVIASLLRTVRQFLTNLIVGGPTLIASGPAQPCWPSSGMLHRVRDGWIRQRPLAEGDGGTSMMPEQGSKIS
jgi:hypothetical protein